MVLFKKGVNMAKVKSIFFCNECGAESSRWLGKCPHCGEWNTYVEQTIKKISKQAGREFLADQQAKVEKLVDIKIEDIQKIDTGYEEINRVLGGGIVPGALMLLGGDPGIGKSTMVMQMCGKIAESSGIVLYASGEESQIQLKLRADRLGVDGKNVAILAATDLDLILKEAKASQCHLLVIDSIQTIYTSDLEMAPGSVAQVRECTAKLLRFAKETNTPVIVIGHVTKDGTIAGPKMLEHMVDVVLYFEGERSYQFRILRAIKNRFGSTSETGIFSMEEEGLVELLDPSEIFLAERIETSGSAVMVYLEGIRPILVEAQSLVSTTAFGLPRRTAIGYDLNRLVLLLAVLEKKANLNYANKDVYINIVGGLKVKEPASDLAVAMALVSGLKEFAFPKDMVFIGEVGLTGNIRSVDRIEQRISEASKMGFKKFIIPKTNAKRLKKRYTEHQIIGVETIRESIEKAYI